MDHEPISSEAMDEEEFQHLERFADRDGFLDIPLDEDVKTLPRHDSENPSNFPVIDGYTLLRKVGEGGTSSVYLARNHIDERLCAVKVLRRSGGNELRLRHRREIQALRRLDHPNIAAFFEAGATRDGLLFLSLEYVDGQRLDHYCHLHQLSIRERVRLMTDVCDAIAHAHSNNILHRDLKPANILVTGGGKPVVTDFGLARLIMKTETESEQTRTGALLGTLNYLAPEQIHGQDQQTSETTDVFGLGAVLHVLLVGSPPFDFRDIVDAFASYYQKFPVRLQCDTGVPADIEAICIKCLSPNPTDRYASVEELKLDLQRFVDGKLVRAKGQFFRRQLQVLARQYPLFTRLSFAALITICISAVAFLLLWQRTRANYVQARQLSEQQEYELSQYVQFVRDIENDPSTLETRSHLLAVVSRSFDRYAANYERDPELLFSVGQCMFKLGGHYHHMGERARAIEEFNKALRAFRRVQELVPEHEEAVFGEYHSLFSLHQYKLATQILDRLLARFPGNYDYKDSKITTELNIALGMINKSELAAADEHVLTALRVHHSIDMDEPSSFDVRRNCKIRFVSAKVAAAQGDIVGALEMMRNVLDQYVALDMCRFPTSGEANEYFAYSRFAISLAAFLHDIDSVTTIMKQCRSEYQRVVARYPNFIHYRWGYGLSVLEYAYFCQDKQPELLPAAIDEIEQCLHDWRTDDCLFVDYWVLILLCPPEWHTPDGFISHALVQQAQEEVARTLIKTPSYMIYFMLRDLGSAAVTSHLKNLLDEHPEDIKGRWLYSRINNLTEDDRYFYPAVVSEPDQHLILAQTQSYHESHFDRLLTSILEKEREVK